MTARAQLSEILRDIPDEVYRHIVDSKDVGHARSRVGEVVARALKALSTPAPVAQSAVNSGNIIYQGEEWVPLSAYQEAMAGWKAANAAQEALTKTAPPVEAELRALAVRALRDYRRRDGLTGYVHDENRQRDERNMVATFEEIVAPAMAALQQSQSTPGAGDALSEARRRLSLVEGCLDCNADDERMWRFIIAFLEEAPWSTNLSATTSAAAGAATTEASPLPVDAGGGLLTYGYMPSRGRADFKQLREAVAEACRGERVDDGLPENLYPGHHMVAGINYNSLDRIVTAFVDAALHAAPAPAEGLVLVPVEPTEAMWGGLARAIMMWLDMTPKTPRALFKHLERSGHFVPQWLRDDAEMKALDHVPSKGTRCAIIYRAMLEDHKAMLSASREPVGEVEA